MINSRRTRWTGFYYAWRNKKYVQNLCWKASRDKIRWNDDDDDDDNNNNNNPTYLSRHVKMKI
jgi:hypothetical protein